MFTGIIAEVGKVRSVAGKSGAVSISVDARKTAPELAVGDSVAVNGVCQTVTAVSQHAFSFETVAETLRLTSLSTLTPGSRVNLEPALRLGDRISGHLVSGHIDCTGIVRVRRNVSRRNVDFTVQIPDGFTRYVHDKGSISLDGVSLTVKAVRGSMVEVTVIPHTLESTILETWRTGTSVNVEVDQLAKYLAPGTRVKGGRKE
ncbi:MAG: riboflavin synthase [Candidatus Eisenbacteria bacterium]